MPFMYILYSPKLDKFYIGACIDLERRMHEHNIGHSKFTSTGMPWQLLYTEKFTSLQEAKQRENKIKSMKSRKYIEGLISNGRASRS
jgi:putative endonuclease